ncbi:MAG: hypothetical protein FWE34_04035 [Defluviitaleaceae bacterium]|nr:hypothetical protein [Defluviitaleaceae bacterium]
MAMGNMKLDKKKPKVGFVTRMVDAINKLYPFKKEEVVERKSRFEGFLRHGEKEGKIGVVSAVRLCDEALDIVSDRIMLTNRLAALDERMAEVECYGKLTDEEVDDLKDMLASYTALAKDSNQLKYQVTSFDKNLVRMERMEEEATADLPEIKFAEERQRMFKQDIGYLEGEKMVLAHERERLRNAIDFVYKFSIALVFFFGGMALVMVYLYIFQNIQTMLVLSSMLIVVVIISALLYALRNRLRYELALNAKKQSKAVELLNKKNAVYAHFTNYLNYEYRKFRVRNSEMLANNLTDFGHYKHLTKRLDSLRNIMSQTEAAIGFFLKDKGIEARFSSIEKFAATLNLDDKKQFYQELHREKNLIEKSLERLDVRSSQIWDGLMNLRENKRDADTINKIIEEYVEKADRILNADRADGTTAMDDVLKEEDFVDDGGSIELAAE